MSSRKEKVVKRYDSWSGFYDFVDSIPPMGTLEKRWRKEAIRLLAIEKGHRVLDMGTGSGRILPWIAEYLDEGEVVGTDLSEKMLDVARARVEKAGCSGKVSLVADDVEASRFGDSSFDRVITTFTMTSVPEPEKAVSEMARLLKKGGKAVVLDTGKPTNPVLRFIFPYIAAVARVFGYTHIYRDIKGIISNTGSLDLVMEKRFFGGMVYILVLVKH